MIDSGVSVASFIELSYKLPAQLFVFSFSFFFSVATFISTSENYHPSVLKMFLSFYCLDIHKNAALHHLFLFYGVAFKYWLSRFRL